MAFTRERKSEEEAARAAKNEETMQLQLQLQQEHNKLAEKEISLREQEYRLKEHEQRMKDKDSEWARFQDENKILLMDLSSCSEFVRDHFIALQHDILQRRMHGGSRSGKN